MKWSFECETFGKWILAGEHAVIRGSEALVFPIRSQSFRFRYLQSTDLLTADFVGATGQEFRLLFWGVLENALGRMGMNRNQVTGRFEIDADLPVGSGLGASGALCVAVARWCDHCGFLKGISVYEFARELENLFHGESSGVDVAVALKGKPLIFSRRGGMQDFSIKWQPPLYLSYSGARGITSDCVARVKELIARDEIIGLAVDEDMKKAVALSKSAMTDKGNMAPLVAAVNLAENCFYRWGLVPSELDLHMKGLKEAGALATKPTGSGGGGFVLSVWNQTPPENLKLISCFETV